MWLTSIVASTHYLALGIGLGAIYARGRAIQRSDLECIFFADNFWGIAAVLWMASGVARAFLGLEKGTSWYINNPWFHVKIGLFGLVFALELKPMITFLKWRGECRRGESPRLHPQIIEQLKRINDFELGIVLLIPFIASLMARYS